uniref:Ubiquitin-like domain-containing protein n=1 Tax=Nelumbo nucifera TaxID=4432 RepID=A0A822YEF4_NELNU|nr:TPA_asm: hypothetical protein HUJ06_031349 [Nelumbo nucifera]
MVVIKVKHDDRIYTVEQSCKLVRDIRKYLQFLVPYVDQLLLYNGRLLADVRMPLTDLGINEEDDDEVEMILHGKLSPRIITVTAHTVYGVFSIEISTVDTVFTLKKMIDERVGMSPWRQSLSTQGAPMSNHWKLERYAISTTLTVFVAENLPNPRWNVAINVEVRSSTGQSMVLNVEKYDSVYTLHGLIRRAGLADEGRDFHLEYAGRQLDGTMDIISYEIESGETVTLIYH